MDLHLIYTSLIEDVIQKLNSKNYQMLEQEGHRFSIETLVYKFKTTSFIELVEVHVKETQHDRITIGENRRVLRTHNIICDVKTHTNGVDALNNLHFIGYRIDDKLGVLLSHISIKEEYAMEEEITEMEKLKLKEGLQEILFHLVQQNLSVIQQKYTNEFTALDEIWEGIKEYGGELTMPPPIEIYDGYSSNNHTAMYIYPGKRRINEPKEFSIQYSLWIDGEVSDLTLDVIATELEGRKGEFRFRIYDCHVM